jgi:hypothetical protein
MNMQAKRITTITVGLLMAGLATWKGPSVAGAVGGAIVALCVLVGTLHVLPAKYDGALVAVEDAVEKPSTRIPPLPLLMLCALALVVLFACTARETAKTAYEVQSEACRQAYDDQVHQMACLEYVRNRWTEAGAPPAAVIEDGGSQ